MSVPRALTLALSALILCLTALAGVAQAATTHPLPYTGGHDAQNDKPFVAGIRFHGGTKFFCTGSLVAPSWVLTAAHCVDGGMRASTVEVVIGDTDLTTSTDPAQLRDANNLVVNARWGGDTADRNDVALIHLTVPSTITPVRLGTSTALVRGMDKCHRQLDWRPPQERYWMMNLCKATTGQALGWGRTPSSGGSSSTKLREVSASIRAWPRNTFWIAKSGACPGDSGGPLLVTTGDGSPRQLGVASYVDHGGGYLDWLYGGMCSSKGYDYYSDVSGGELRFWVDSIV